MKKTLPWKRRWQAVWLILTATPVTVTIEMQGYGEDHGK